MGAIEKATSLIGEGFKVEAENVEDLFKTMPQLFEDAIVDAKTGIVQLNEDIVRSARNAAAQEAEGWAGSMAETLQARINWENNQIDALNIVKDTALSASDTVYINELLNEKGLKTEKAKSVAAII
ncbi:MAG: hypothetical protein IKY94_15195 [Lachnospiraceae bacterium]|nr:hypothetical protein [Lachnospiraceae bacterium]